MIRKAMYILFTSSCLLGNDEFFERSEKDHYASTFPVQSPAVYAKNDVFDTTFRPIDSPYCIAAIIGYILCVKKIYKELQGAIAYKKRLKEMSYDDFKDNFSELLSIEERIISIQNLLQLSESGTFPEQIYARIHLVRSQLPFPYDTITDICVKKYYETNFDEQGRFIWKESGNAKRCYKKFYSKVPQDFRALVSCSKKLQYVKKERPSMASVKTENIYNQTLLDMVHEGIKENFPTLHKILRSRYDALLEKLYRYYVDKKSATLVPEGLKTIPREYKERVVLQDWYEKEMFQWLSPQSSNNMMLREAIHEVLIEAPVLELPMMSDYRFFLLRKCMEKICDVEHPHLSKYKELFQVNGILKKYAPSAAMHRSQTEFSLSKDPLLHKAVNFALAIVEKEQDEITKKLAGKIEFCFYQILQTESVATAVEYKNKIALLYEALSYRKYEQDILEICKKN